MQKGEQNCWCLSPFGSLESHVGALEASESALTAASAFRIFHFLYKGLMNVKLLNTV